MRRERHVLLLRPLVARGVVLPHRAGRGTRHADRIPPEEIQLPAGDDAIALFVRFRNWREPGPSGGASRLARPDPLNLSVALPAAAASLCGERYRRYQQNRKENRSFHDDEFLGPAKAGPYVPNRLWAG